MNSWSLLICYPQRTFDPMITTTSTELLWVTIAYFRTCSKNFSHSQARLMDYHVSTPHREVDSNLGAPPIRFWRPPPQWNCRAAQIFPHNRKLWDFKMFYSLPESMELEAALPTNLGGVSRLLCLNKAPTYTEQNCQNGHERRAVKVHGVLSSRANFLASSREHQLRRRPGETVGQWWHHSCRTAMNRQWISLPLDR